MMSTPSSSEREPPILIHCRDGSSEPGQEEQALDDLLEALGSSDPQTFELPQPENIAFPADIFGITSNR